MVWFCIFWTLLLMGGGDGARILWVQPTVSKSHIMVGEPLIVELARRGHNITFVSNFPLKNPMPNIHELDLSHKRTPYSNNLSFTDVKRSSFSFHESFVIADIEMNICQWAFSDPKMLGLLDSEDEFDLVITETFMMDCFAPFAYKFRAPLITLVTSTALPWVADRMGLPDNPAYIPNYFVGLSSKMTLLERVYNTITLIYNKLFYRYYALPRAERFVKTNFGNSLPHLNQILKNTSLMFLNSHFTLSITRPFPPNVVEIGGIHLKTLLPPLPQDLQDILDRSTQGVILVSFGSLLRTASIPKPVIRMFLQVFSKISQCVIFKYEEDLHGIPRNVIVRKWIPQRQIMEHNNTRLLVTHGGLASVIEAAHFGVPIIGMSLFADQFLNVKGMVQRGSGIMLEFNDLSVGNIEAAITEVLTNKSYAENVKRLSLQFRDRPKTPLQTAVFWTEYVIRHQGAPHLQPASVHLPLYQYLLLDVLTVLLLPLLALVYIIYFLLFRAGRVRYISLQKKLKNKLKKSLKNE